MKRTTYIIVGTLLFFMVAMFIGIYYCSLGGNQKKMDLVFSSELTQIDLSGVRVIRLLRTDEKHGNFVSGVMRVLPSSGSKKELSYSKDLGKYIKRIQKGDTLTLDLCFSDDLLPEEFSNRGFFTPSNLQFCISTDSTLNTISSDISGLTLAISGLDRNKMSFSSRSLISVDSCSFQSVKFSGLPYSRTHLDLNRSKISNLYLDAKELDWDVDSCDIDTEYILESGGSNNIHTWKKGECKKLIWNSRQSGEKLFLAIDEGTSITFQ